MDKKRILMIGPGRGVRGGISSVVNNYYALGIEDRVKIKYISTMEDGNKAKKLLVALLAYIRFCLSLKNCDMVHVHMSAQASFTRKSLFVKKAHSAGKSIIIHQHAADFDDYYFEQSNDANRRKIKTIFSYADKVIVLSEEWADFFGTTVCDKEKIEILHNGVILPAREKSDYSDHNVLFLGRLGERKGIYDLLKAVPRVLKKVPDAMFFLGGDGDVDKCRRIIENSGLSEHVKLLGWVRNEVKEKYLTECGIYILPSYHEGMPMSVLEAMSYGLATVSTNAGGIPRVINDGVDGFRIEAGDTDAITDTLVRLLCDEALKSRIGKAGRERIREHFNAAANLDKLLELYAAVLK